jgi:hypothetical protein
MAHPSDEVLIYFFMALAKKSGTISRLLTHINKRVT